MDGFEAVLPAIVSTLQALTPLAVMAMIPIIGFTIWFTTMRRWMR